MINFTITVMDKMNGNGVHLLNVVGLARKVTMIYLYPVSIKVKKYCTHCDAPAEFELMACNPRVVQQSTTACFCGQCMARLKKLVSQVHITQQPYAVRPKQAHNKGKENHES